MTRTRRNVRIALVGALVSLAGVWGSLHYHPTPPRRAVVKLFDGTSLSAWKVPRGDNGHWKIQGGVIDYDGRSEASGEKHLWSKSYFKDFALDLEWRITAVEGMFDVYEVLPDGRYKRDDRGNELSERRPVSDSGVYLRGSLDAQVNLWVWPIGSGELYPYRTDETLPAEVRAAVTPKLRADKPLGEWNAMRITLVGDRITIVLNQQTVIENARLPGIPPEGPIGLQHHGIIENGQWVDPPSLVQFRNVTLTAL